MTCTTCGVEKELTHFRLEKRGFRRRRCNECRWLARRCQNRGITVEQYFVLFNQQGGRCAICGQPETRMKLGKILPLSIDHNHETHEVRGLLCGPCNSAIGLLKEDPKLFKQALKYLRGDLPSAYA